MTAKVAAKIERAIPAQSGVPEIPYGYEPAHEPTPVTLILERETLRISHDLIQVMARTPDQEGDVKVGVIVIRAPDDELVWDTIFVHGKLRMVFGFVPDAARRTVASLFRYNDTITVG